MAPRRPARPRAGGPGGARADPPADRRPSKNGVSRPYDVTAAPDVAKIRRSRAGAAERLIRAPAPLAPALPMAALQRAPDSPQGRGIAERITVHEREVRRTADRQPARPRVAQHLTTAPGGRAQGLPRLQPGAHQALDLPGQVASPDRAAAEVTPGRDGDAGRVRHPDALLRGFEPLSDALPAGPGGE